MGAMNRDQRKLVRHPWHGRIVAISALVTLTLIIVAVIAIALIATGHLRLGDLSARAHKFIALAIAVVLVVPGFLVFVRTAASTKPRAEGVIITEHQLREIHELAAGFARLVGLPATPTIVLAGGPRPLSASHSRFGHNIIVLHADLLEAPRPTNGEMASLRFAMAREIGQLASGGRTFGQQFLTMVSQSTPYLSRILSRAEDYTGDRWGALLAPDAAADYFGHLTIGKSLWIHANMHEIAASAGPGGLSETMTSWFMEHPPIPWRVRGLAPFGIFAAKTLHRLHLPDPKAGGKSDSLPYAAMPPPAPAPSAEIIAERMSAMDFGSTAASFWHRPAPLTRAELTPLCDNLSVAEFVTQLPNA